MTPNRLLPLLLAVLASPAWASPILPASDSPAAEFPDAASPAAPAASAASGAAGGAPLAGGWSAAAGFHGAGFNRNSRDAVAFDDGSGPALYVGGDFTAADAVLASRVAKWSATGGWQALGAGMNAEVVSLALFDDGGGTELYAGGLFTSAGGAPIGFIAKWDGSSWSAVGGGVDNSVFALAVYDDGGGPALYAGGSFTSAGGAPASRIAKWNGSAWSSVGAGVDPGVRSLHVWDDGGGPALYAGGFLTSAGGAPAGFIAKWNGSSWSALGSGLDGLVSEITSIGSGPGSALYAGGSFTTAGGAPANRVARWNGSAWSAVGAGFDNSVLGLQSFDDGGGEALYASGGFRHSGATPVQAVARFDGSSWVALGATTISGSPAPFVSELVPFTDAAGSRLIALGSFDRLGGAPSTQIAGWAGASWTGLTSGSGRGAADWVAATAAHDDGDGAELYVGGDFFSAGGVFAPSVAKWNGIQWEALGTGLDNRVNVIATYDDGGGPALYAGGQFANPGGVAGGGVAKWDGAAWSPLGGSVNGEVLALEVFDDGGGPALYAGGSFTTADGMPALRVVRWDGSAWSAVGGLDNRVTSLAVYDAGGGPALYAGGNFTASLGGPVSYLARWNGTDWVAVPGSPPSPIDSLRVIQLGGAPVLAALRQVLTAGFQVAFTLATWDGAAWSYLDPLFYATGVANHDDGTGPGLFATGYTDSMPAGVQHLVKWNGSAWVDQGIELNGREGTRLRPFDDGSGPALFVGGTFSQAGGVASSYFAKLRRKPLLSVPASTPVAEGGLVELPVELETAGNGLSVAAFSIDYDESCLDPDANGDGSLDAVAWSLPAGFTPLVDFDPLDLSGEIDIAVVDLSPPFAALPGGELARIRFRASCPLSTAAVDAPIAFSSSPAPSFGDLAANDVAGSWQGGVVHILRGPRGDCNGMLGLTGADLAAIAREIFDGDGSFWLDAPLPTYPGTPVGCDANASTQITAADVPCANLLIFGRSCAAPFAELAGIAPILEVSSTFDNGVVWLRGRLLRNGNAVGSLAYSLDLDPARFDFAGIDANHDGVPDRLRFPQGAPGLAFVAWSAADADGELDVLLADLSQQPLAEGLLVEVGIPAAAAQPSGFGYSADPPPNFGTVQGGDLPGIAVLGNLLFSDGFESGNTAAWSLAVP